MNLSPHANEKEREETRRNKRNKKLLVDKHTSGRAHAITAPHNSGLPAPHCPDPCLRFPDDDRPGRRSRVEEYNRMGATHRSQATGGYTLGWDVQVVAVVVKWEAVMVIQLEVMVIQMEAMVIQLDVMVIQLEAMVIQLDAMVIQLKAMVIQLEAMLIQLETMVIQLEVMVLQVEVMVIQLEVMAIQLEVMVIQWDTDVAMVIQFEHILHSLSLPYLGGYLTRGDWQDNEAQSWLNSEVVGTTD